MTKTKTFVKAFLVGVATLLALTALTGCTPQVAVKEIYVAVATPCISTFPDKPVMPLQAASKDEDLHSKTKKALAEIELRKGYEEKLEALLIPCKTGAVGD
jgi:hypothetical protein